MNIENEIDFILFHFENSLFPRTMMTKRHNYQFMVNSREEIIQKCLKSNLIDCRINAYPSYVKWEKYNLITYPPNFVFIDLDLENFKKYKNPEKMLDKTLKEALDKINLTFPKEHSQRSLIENARNNYQRNHEFTNETRPTVLWTGNGYHIYLPIYAMVLDQESIFSRERFPNLFSTLGKYSNWSVSEVFLKYAEIFFTSGKADPQHKPKYKTCLIRIPGSYNSKLLYKGLGKEGSLVKVIQRWNGKRIPIQYMLKEFRRWLVQEEYNQKLENDKRKHLTSITRHSTSYVWIENLLQTPLEDHRKYCLLHILIPYLVNVKGLSNEAVSRVIGDWLSKCNTVKALKFNPAQEIRNRIKYVKDYNPMSLTKLQKDNDDLYRLLTDRIESSNRTTVLYRETK